MTIKIPSMLSFERKLECSDGLMYSGDWEDKGKDTIEEIKERDGKEVKIERQCWNPILIGKPRKNRGTKSMYMEEKKRSEVIEPNVAEGDDANLPMNKDTLKLSFSLRVIGNLGKPFACNMPGFADAIETKVKALKESDDIDELAKRYAYNIANGRFLWRNRVCAEAIEIHVEVNDKGKEKDTEAPKNPIFNAYDFNLKNFNNPNNEQALEYLQKIEKAIKKGLKAGDDFILIKVNAYVKLGQGQHVFPSQEMNMGEKKKKLFQLDGCAAMHNVKIGNAIRTIDTWYGDEMLIKAEGKDKTETISIPEEIKGLPIAIEPYGSVTQHGRAYRHKENDLYSLMGAWVNGDIDADKQKFVVANLIRGGVFGGDS